MNNLYRILRYNWPLHFVLLFTNWLPDNTVFLRLRGFFASFFFKKCGKNLRLGRNITFYNSSKISVGSDVYIAMGCWFLGAKEIVLHDEVMFGPYCVIADSNHTLKNTSYRFGPSNPGTIEVGRGTWIGAHSILLKDIRIGKGVLVAANSVVNKDIEDLQVVGGVPIKELTGKP